MVDDPDPVAGADLGRAFDQLDQPEALPVEAHGQTALEAELDLLGLVGCLLRARDELEHVVVGGVAEVLDPAALRGASPEVVVDRVGHHLGALLERDPVLAGVGDLLLAAHLPGANRGDHLQLRSERRDRGLDPDLVVALAGAAVGDRVAAAGAGVLDRELRDQWASERGEQRVAGAVDGVGPDRRGDEVGGELLAGVHGVDLERAQLAGLRLDHLEVLARLAEVDRQAHDLGPVSVLDPLQHHARVQAAGVQQQHAPDLLGIGLVAGAAQGRDVARRAHGAES